LQETMTELRRWLAAALALLTLVSGVVTASEVAAHGICEHAGSSLLVDAMHEHAHDHPAGDDRSPGHDHQSSHDHICHVHPPAHGHTANALPAPPPLSSAGFAFIPRSFQSLLLAPPVPPPNA
jgi:hypothetical protein